MKGLGGRAVEGVKKGRFGNLEGSRSRKERLADLPGHDVSCTYNCWKTQEDRLKLVLLVQGLGLAFHISCWIFQSPLGSLWRTKRSLP